MDRKRIKKETCILEGCNKQFTPFKFGQKHCSSKCFYEDKKQKDQQDQTEPKKKVSAIRKVSKKREVINRQYTEIRREYLKTHTVCFIDGCDKIATTIEHRAGRIGFADEFARLINIPLIIDTRFFAPCCLRHNLELENNPELSRMYQLSKITLSEKTEKQKIRKD